MSYGTIVLFSLKFKTYFGFQFCDFSVCMLLLIIFSTTASSLHSGRNPTNAPNPCEGLPNDTFVTNPKGCKYMFHCRNGQPFEAFCPGDMWFNPDSGICDYRSNVDCHLDDTKPIRNPEEFIFCPLKDSKVPTFRASSIDCARYYLCYHGKPVHQQCAGDLQWNKVTEQCDVANKVNCVVS